MSKFRIKPANLLCLVFGLTLMACEKKSQKNSITPPPPVLELPFNSELGELFSIWKSQLLSLQMSSGENIFIQEIESSGNQMLKKQQKDFAVVFLKNTESADFELSNGASWLQQAKTGQIMQISLEPEDSRLVGSLWTFLKDTKEPDFLDIDPTAQPQEPALSITPPPQKFWILRGAHNDPLFGDVCRQIGTWMQTRQLLAGVSTNSSNQSLVHCKVKSSFETDSEKPRVILAELPLPLFHKKNKNFPLKKDTDLVQIESLMRLSE